jgi:hypothetical protein
MRRIFGRRRDEVTGNGENYTMKSLMIGTAHTVLFADQIEKNKMGRACGTYEEGEMYKGFWWG